jgi:ribosome recycling factor
MDGGNSNLTKYQPWHNNSLAISIMQVLERPAIAYYSSRANLTMMATIMQASDNYSLCQPWHNNRLTICPQAK